MSRLGVSLQHPGSGTIIESESDKLLGRGTINGSRRTRGGLSDGGRDGGDQERGDMSISKEPTEFTDCVEQPTARKALTVANRYHDGTRGHHRARVVDGTGREAAGS